MRAVLQLTLIILVIVSGPVEALSRTEVREVQWILNELGYTAGPDDGILGRKTTRAATTFRDERGFPDSSSVDLSLLHQLPPVSG
uniref:Peptidoglycan binding domain-containing protein n=1 Tax=Candidatus Kentrum sp. FW TaxID=2126338 RepID=A0A450TAT5_9GAMM|nr:MAG: Putative peptidoglycan binding domain-containing protein [Candidatus Kentron sp. FW]